MIFTIILLSFVFVVVLSDEFCETNADKYRAYNYGSYLVVETHKKGEPTKFWAYMTADQNLIDVTDHALKEEIFGDIIKPNDIEVVLTFDFNDCKNSSKYCQIINKTKDLVVVQYKSQKSGLFPYKCFRSTAHSVVPIKDRNEMPWNWSPEGNINVLGIFPPIETNWKYYSGSFFTLANRMVLVTTGPNPNNGSNIQYLFDIQSQQINSSGALLGWYSVLNAGFDGLFQFNNQLYAISSRDSKVLVISPDFNYKVKSDSVKKFFECDRILNKSTTGQVITFSLNTSENRNSSENTLSPIDTTTDEYEYINETFDTTYDTTDDYEYITDSFSSTHETTGDYSDSKPESESTISTTSHISKTTELDYVSGIEGFVLFWIILIVIFIIILAIILFVMYKRKKRILNPKDSPKPK